MHNNLNVIALKKQKIKWRLNINANQYQPMQLAVLSTLLFGLLTPQAVAEQLKTANMLAAANARGEEIILLGDEELVTDSQLKSATQNSSYANTSATEKVNQNPVLIRQNKIANQKKAGSTKKASIAKPATGENAVISKIEFKQANMLDVARALSDMSGLNIVTTDAAAKKNVTVFLQNISVKNALDIISKNSGLWYRYDKTAKNYRIMTTDEYQSDLVIYRDDVTRVYDIMHPNPFVIANAIKDLYGNRVRLSIGVEDNTSMGNFGAAGAVAATTRNVGGNNSSLNSSRQNNNSQNPNGAGGNNNETGSERVVISEKLSSEKIAKIEEQLRSQNGDKTISTEILRDVSAQEQPIYVTLNREHSFVVVRTSDVQAIKDIEDLIKQMDRPTQQVLLEMKILSLDVGDTYRQGVDIDYIPDSTEVRGPTTDQDRNPLHTTAGTQSTSTNTSTNTDSNGNTSTSTGTTTGTIARGGVRNILGLGNFALEGGTFVYQFMNDNIRARIQLLQTNNKINTLSSPILLATNNKPARVFVGTEQVITTGFDAVAGGANAVSTGSPAVIPVTEVRNVGNTLQIMPKINANGTVTLMIQQDSSSILTGASSIPVIVGSTVQRFSVDSVKTSNIQGTVVAKDGLTVAIGGLIDTTESEEEQKVPLLGDIPLLGELFKRKATTKGKRELLLLITPHIIANPQDAEDLTRDAIEPISDQEW
jgi:general secretion pathway protein D